MAILDIFVMTAPMKAETRRDHSQPHAGEQFAQPELSKLHSEHYFKLLDLFETRQTWTFNFAVAVYAVAVTAFGSLVEKAILPGLQGGSAEADVSVAVIVSVFSIALPLLMLPLCFLFCDVSIFCAALAVGNRRFNARLQETLRASDPGILAAEWLREHKIDLDRLANRRMILFVWAPAGGLLAALLGILYSIFRVRWAPVVSASIYGSITLSVAGFVVSVVALPLTLLAYRAAAKARTESIRDALSKPG